FIALGVRIIALTARIRPLPAREIVEFFQSYQHISRFGPIRGAEHPCQLELIDDPGCPAVSDAHPALQQGRRSKLVLDAYLGGLPEQRIAFPGSELLAPAPLFFFLG